MEDNERTRIFNLLLYPDDETMSYAIDLLKNDKYDCCGILHDKDVKTDTGELKKAHYHFVVKFQNARTISAVAKELHISSRFIEPCNSFKGSLKYLTHFGIKEKYQYNTSELFGSLTTKVVNLLDYVVSEDDKVKQIIKFVENHNGRLSTTEVVKFAINNGLYSAVRRANYIFTIIVKEHNENLREG